MTLDSGPMMPPNPGAGGAAFAGKQDVNQIQQKMAKQRQLALERRRMAGRMTAGGMAQANQLPAPSSQLPSKAPGWDRVLGEGIDVKPGSLAEKAEAAFNDAKGGRPTPLGMKASTPLMSVDEKGEVETMSTALEGVGCNPGPGSRSGMHAPMATSGIEEIEVSDDIDFDQPSSFDQPSGGRKPGPMQMPGGQSQQAQQQQNAKASPGWGSLQEEEPAAQAQQPAAAEAGQEAGGRRWYNPTTWTKPKQSAAKANAGEDNSVTCVQGFNENAGVQRMGLRTPDSDAGAPLSFSGPSRDSPQRRRPRQPESQSPVPQSTAAEMDFSLFDCPGAIIDAPLPAASPLPSKAQSNAKHHSAAVERAAFPSEERRRVASPPEQPRPQVQASRPPASNCSLAELEAQKKDAIGREDFMEAQRIKGQIEALQADAFRQPAPAPAPAQQNAVQSFSAPRRRDDVVETMLNDDDSDFGSRAREVPQGGGRPREQAPGSSWNTQVEEPPRVSPTPEEPVRKRFWKRAAKPTL